MEVTQQRDTPQSFINIYQFTADGEFFQAMHITQLLKLLTSD